MQIGKLIDWNDMIEILEKLKSKLSSMLSGNDVEYSARLVAELKAYKDCANVNDLPEIFHYWSNKYLLAMMKPFGFTSPDEFFYTYLEKVCAKSDGSAVRIVSIGSGNCDLEIKWARQLTDSGVGNFVFECIELNPNMLDRGFNAAKDHGVQNHIRFLPTDFNLWVPETDVYDAVIANQSLHHACRLAHGDC